MEGRERAEILGLRDERDIGMEGWETAGILGWLGGKEQEVEDGGVGKSRNFRVVGWERAGISG